MTQERSSVYRGETREMAEAAYHADARAMVRMGYAPTSEDWSSVLEEVLTVRYVHAPEQGSAVLEALAEAEAERAIPRPSPAPSVLQRVFHRAASFYDGQTPELKLTVGAITGMAAGVALWSLLGSLFFGDNPILLFLSLFALGFAGGLVGAMVTLPREFRGR
jgi:hypothetical protein